MPAHPRRRGWLAGKERATTQSVVAPNAVSSVAQNHAVAEGRAVCAPGFRNSSASIPGQAKRYAAERHPACVPCSFALHHVNHFKLMKIANERIHMNTQAGQRLRSAMAVAGKSMRGSHPTHPECCSLGRLAGCISSSVLSVNAVTFLPK